MVEGVRLRFNEAKATEAAAYLLKLCGGRMKYLKLIKLLYLADRQALLRWGRPITNDRYVAMKYGPVVSTIYDLITSEPMPGVQSDWQRHIETIEDWTVRLKAEPPRGELSPIEEDLLMDIFRAYGEKDQWAIVREMHGFAEWRDSGGSSTPISYADILRAQISDECDVAERLDDLTARAAAESILQPL